MIRDEDITNLIQCDLAVFNYDGSELDSGTVVEFMFAKFADIPSLILRTDFRGGGDCAGIEEKLPWNLMSSFYPRTKVLLADSSMLYKKAFCCLYQSRLCLKNRAARFMNGFCRCPAWITKAAGSVSKWL